jgi:hypothetical protein
MREKERQTTTIADLHGPQFRRPAELVACIVRAVGMWEPTSRKQGETYSSCPNLQELPRSSINSMGGSRCILE